MLCRSVRCLLGVRLTVAGLLCLALIGTSALPAGLHFGYEEVASISLRSPEAPLAALATTSAVRFEKQANSVRLVLPRPGRGARLSAAQRPSAMLVGPKAHRAVHVLPRRFLQPRQLTPRTPNDSGDPFLVSLLLS